MISILTPRQKQILDFITASTKKRGYAPSLEEIKKRLKLNSVSNIHQHISALQEKGYLDKQKNSKRGIAIPEAETMVSIPLLGSVSAGEPIHVYEQKESIAVPKNKLPNSNNVYALQVRGNSMIDENIHDGDIALINHQTTAENGQRVVALIDNT